MAEECHGGGDVHHGLAHEGEDGEKGHSLRIEMEHVDLIVLEHRVEEGGEGRKQASPEGINEDRDLGNCLSHAAMRCGPIRRLSPLVETGLVVEH